MYAAWFAQGLEICKGPFYGGDKPHYADFAIWSMAGPYTRPLSST